ncbi:MAG: VWA domain-containing protein [Chloroflexi bacterium]|nr:VWA domain-containing protein [Chloroflexota bacterium]
MPLMVLAVAMALVGGVLVIGIGLLLDEKRQAQAAADFAALAAAQDLPRSVADPDLAAKIAAAELSAAEYLDWNGYDASDPNVSTNIVTNYAGNIDKIEVRVSRPRPWLIGQIFGLADVDVGGRAVAAANALPRDVAVALDRSGSMCLFSHGGPKSVCDEVTARAGAPGSSPNPLTAAIQAESGDMVIAGATAGQSGSYSAQNGFVVATNQNANSTMTFATVQKLSGGGSETISVQHTNPNRQELVGMTLRRGSADVVQLGGWQTGLDNHNAPAGIDRSLVFIAGWEDGGFPDLNSVRYGGRDLTLVRKGEIPSSGSKVGVEIWMLSAAEIALASNNDFTVNWDEGVSSFRYAHAFFEHTAQTPLGAYEPFDTMRNAAESFVDTFQPVVEGAPFDFVSLVSYNSEALLEQGLTQDYVGAGNALSTALWAMVPATSTNIGHAIAVARMELADHGTPGSVKMIVLLTDGQANRYRTGGTDLAPTFVNCTEPCALADEYALDEATIAAQQGIAIYTIGLTASAGGQLLIDIANIGATLGGGGQFFEVDDPSALSETFDQISELLNYALVE